MARHNKIGVIGEDLACKFLEKQGFTVIERNYRKKWGELDIVAVKDRMLHFVEVKTAARDLEALKYESQRGIKDWYKPEDNIHDWKVKRLRRIIQTYIAGKGQGADWQFDVVTVFLDERNCLAKVFLHNNIIL